MSHAVQDITTPPPKSKLTYKQFLQLDLENPFVEWVDGATVQMPPVADEHEIIRGYLFSLLHSFAEETDSGEVRSEPFQMKTGPNLPGRAPDVLFLSKANLNRLKRLCVEGPADIAVEIISPESRSRDRGEKFYEYEQGGVTEYWLIDPQRKQAEFYRRGADGIYRLVPPDAQNVFHSEVLKGLWLNVDWLWQRPTPTVRSVLKMWGI